MAAYLGRSVMNNGVSSTVLMSKLAGLTLVDMCMLHCSEVE